MPPETTGISLGDAVIRFTADASDLANTAKVEGAVGAATEVMGREFKEALAPLGELSRQSELLSGILATLTKKVDDTGRGAGPATKTWDVLAKTLGVKTTVEVQGTIKTLEQLRAEMIKANAPAADLQRVTEQLVKSQKELASLSIPKSTGLYSMIGSGLSGMGKGIASAAMGFGAFSIGQGLVMGLVGQAKEATDAVLEFEKSWANARTIIDASKYNVDQIRESLLSLNTELGSAKDLTEAFYEAISSGIAPDKATAFVETAARFGKSVQASLTDSTRLLTSIIHAYKMEVKDASEIADILFKTIEVGVVRGNELAQSFGRITPIAASLKVPLREVSGLLAALTLTGLDFDEAVTAMRQAMMNFIAPAPQATDLAHRLGVEIGKAGMEGKTFTEALFNIARASKGNTEAMDTFFGNIRALVGVLALTNMNADTFRRSMDEIGNSANTQGAHLRGFTTQVETLGTQLERFGTIWDRIWQKIAGDTGPTARILRDVLNAFEAVSIGPSGNLATVSPSTVLMEYLTKELQNKDVLAAKQAELFKSPGLPSGYSPLRGSEGLPSGLTPGQRDFIKTLESSLDKITAINNKYEELKVKVVSTLPKEYQDQYIKQIERRRDEEIAAIRKVDEEKKKRAQEEKQRQEEQFRRDVEASEKSWQTLLKTAGLKLTDTVDLREQEQALRTEYELRIQSGAATTDLIQIYEAWRRKVMELNGVLKENNERQVEYDLKLTQSMQRHYQARMETMWNIEQWSMRAPSFVSKGIPGKVYGQGELSRERARSISLDETSRYLGVNIKDKLEQIRRDSEDVLNRIYTAWEKHEVSIADVQDAEMVHIEAVIETYRRAGKEIPETLRQQYDAMRKEREKNAKSEADEEKRHKATVKAMADIGSTFRDAMVQGVGTGLAAFISGQGSFADALKGTLAQLAQYFMVRSIGELAEGIADLFLNPADAGRHFMASALFGAAATASGLASRSITPSSGNSSQYAGAGGQRDYERREPSPYSSQMVGRNYRDSYFDSSSPKISSIVQQYNMAQPSANYNISIHAVDSKSFDDMVTNNPRAVVRVVQNDILSNGRLRKMTSTRSTS